MFKTLLHILPLLGLSLLLTHDHALAAPRQEIASRIERLLNFKVTHHGPNCWNSALVASGVLSRIRFTSAAEFQFLIESPACQKIAPGTQAPGDIQVYRRTLPGLKNRDREVHANIWLDERSTFNKKTDFATAPYEVTTHEIVNESYARTPEILVFSLGASPRASVRCAGETCDNAIEYRRCGAIESLKRHDALYSAHIETLIDSLERAIQIQVQNPAKGTLLWNARASEILNQLSEAIENHCGAENSFFCAYARNAQESMAWQIQRPQPNWLEGN